MVQTKGWYKSKTVQASAVAMVIALLDVFFGIGNQWTTIVIALAGAIGIYGRVTANTVLK